MYDKKSGKFVPGYLRNLKLAEVSGCDVPANPHAKVVLLKSDGSVEKSLASTDDLPEAIRKTLPADAQAVFLAAANKALAEHDETEAFKIAWAKVREGWERTGATWAAKAKADPEESETANESADTGDDEDETPPKGKGKPKDKGSKGKTDYPWMTEKVDGEATDGADAASSEAGSSGTNVGAKESNMPDDTKKVGELESQITALKAQLETATADTAKLAQQVKDTETAKSAAEAKVAEFTKAAEVAKTDEVLSITDPADVTKMVEIRKSDIGPAHFAFVKAQQARIEKAESEREEIVFAKRADTEIGNLPGESSLKGKVLKAVEGISDEAVRTATLAALKAGNAAMKMGFTPIGNGGGATNGNRAEDRLDQMAEEHAKTAGVTKAKAYDVVIQSDEGRRLYAESLGRAN